MNEVIISEETKKVLTKIVHDIETCYVTEPKSPAEITPEKKEEMLSIKECKARIPGLSEYTLRKLIKQNKVISIRSGEGENGKFLVNFNSLREYLGFTDNKQNVA